MLSVLKGNLGSERENWKLKVPVKILTMLAPFC